MDNQTVVVQRFIQLLELHPWFEVAWHAASERSAGLAYAKAANWRLKTPIPERIAQAEENIALFRAPKPGERTRTLMAHSAFSCMVCHQQ